MPRYPASLSGLYFSSNRSNTSVVNLSSEAPFHSLSAWTVECWVNISAFPPTGGNVIFYDYNGGTNTGFQLYNFSNYLVVQAGNGSVSQSIDTTPSSTRLSLNNWVKVEASWDGTNLRIFQGGVLLNTGTLSGGTTGNAGQIPMIGSQGGSGRAFGGIISELRISNIVRHTTNYTPETYPLTADANTIGLYHTNEGSGTTTADSSSQNNTGTLSGSPLPTWADGRFSGGPSSRTAVSSQPRVGVQNVNASWFGNGSNSSISLGSVLGTTPGPFSVAAWIKPSAIQGGGFGRIFDDNSVYSFFAQNAGSGQLVGQVTCSGGTTQTAALGINIFNSWHRVVMTFDGISTDYPILYLDGAQVGTHTQSATGTINGLGGSYIGNRSLGDRAFWGGISQVLVYNRVLSPTEVLSDLKGNYSTNGLVGWWNLTEGAGTTAYDTSGNGNNGTITAGTYTSDVPSKARQLVGGNLVYNGNFEFAPPTNVAYNGASGRWIDGTPSGTTTNPLFGWAEWNHITTNNLILFDSSNSHSGIYALKVSTTGTGSQMVAATIPLTSSLGQVPSSIPVLPNTSYTLTFWMKTNYVSGASNDGAYINIVEYNGSGATGASHQSTKVQITTGWAQYTVTFTTASTAAYLALQPQVSGQSGLGTLIMDAWFDDIFLQQTTPPTRGLVT